MKFEGFDWAIFSLFFGIIVAGSIITYDAQQQRVLFQQTYNKNLECRQSIKDQSVEKITDICGTVPVVGDFVK